MTNYAVIGAGFGDEGKGLLTDYLTRKLGPSDTLVVRVNGGAQAGHTVTTDQHRHVFSHFGAGTLAGSKTYLSSNFIVNPFAFLREWDQLAEIGYTPETWAHPLARVSTIWDIAYNQLQEISRGKDKHGSCGLGINATITRNQDPSAMLNLQDSYWATDRALERIQEYYAPLLAQYADIPEYESYVPMFDIGREWQLIERMLEKLEIGKYSYRRESNAIFECAQGLGLDELMGEFPHVTRSITGLASAIHAAVEMNVTEITPVYVTRCYVTRHGAGPLDWEDLAMDFSQVVDPTNKPNAWQDSLRFAPLDLTTMYENIGADWERSQAMATVFNIKLNTPEVAITCLDQFDQIVYVHPNTDQLVTVPSKEFISHLKSQGQVKVKYTSWGPRATDVQEID